LFAGYSALNATSIFLPFKDIAVLWRRSVLLVEGTEVPEKKKTKYYKIYKVYKKTKYYKEI
jgi:hypothetical protein